MRVRTVFCRNLTSAERGNELRPQLRPHAARWPGCRHTGSHGALSTSATSRTGVRDGWINMRESTLAESCPRMHRCTLPSSLAWPLMALKACSLHRPQGLRFTVWWWFFPWALTRCFSGQALGPDLNPESRLWKLAPAARAQLHAHTTWMQRDAASFRQQILRT
jgi:hypothetical protein